MGGGGNAHQMFNSRQPPKKKRKSRTAFTNHQIFELEKRFLYQKYLSPADRDDIAQQLGLTNAQVSVKGSIDTPVWQSAYSL
jgi:homeobox protein LBX